METKVMIMLLFILCTLFDTMIAFNHTSAEAECRERNGLASYRHFVGDEGSGLDKDYNLKEGESAWISGNVKFSMYVSYYGCYSEDGKDIYKYILNRNNIYYCLQKCTKINGIMFVGLRNEFCYCSKRTGLADYKVELNNDCNQELVYSNLKSGISDASIDNNINMFRIINHESLNWVPPFSESRSQCVTVRSNGKEKAYETESCYSKRHSFICLNSEDNHTPNVKCYGSKAVNFCIISGSNSWKTSFEYCLQYKGKLINYLINDMKTSVTTNISYWTGIFRTFEIENKIGFSDKSVCLSVKKVNGKIVFEPADCSTKKKFICEFFFSKETESTSVKTSVDAKTNSVSTSNFFTTTVVENTTLTFATKFLSSKSTTQTTTEDTELDHNVVYISVGAIVTVTLCFIIICVILRKQKRSKATSSTNRSNSKDHDINITDNSIRGSVLDVAQNHKLSQNVEDEVTYAKPDTAKNLNEYDSIRVKSPGKQKVKTANAETIDDHVYGFHSANTIDSDIEVYDHLEAARKKNYSKPTDGIYNTLAEDSETYNVLALGNKEESSKSSVNLTQIKETCPTYDKLK